MTRRARLVEAGPRVRLPEPAADGVSVAGRVVTPSREIAGPVRTCVGCRERGQRTVLLRVVLVNGGEGSSLAVADTARSLPGRGAWLHADLHCLELAERRRAFPRALRVGQVDSMPVREHLESVQAGDDPAARPSFTEKESGLEADGHPMSTQR
ncbi:MAG: YlxR family protein [Cellulomonadaceae bacterium]|nr:YlxR family protein [Cellulomonadaceae bacterium]